MPRATSTTSHFFFLFFSCCFCCFLICFLSFHCSFSLYLSSRYCLCANSWLSLMFGCAFVGLFHPGICFLTVETMGLIARVTYTATMNQPLTQPISAANRERKENVDECNVPATRYIFNGPSMGMADFVDVLAELKIFLLNSSCISRPFMAISQYISGAVSFSSLLLPLFERSKQKKNRNSRVGKSEAGLAKCDQYNISSFIGKMEKIF